MHFSPTNTTKRICNAVASGMGAHDAQVLDITLPKTRAAIIADINEVFKKIDHLIVGSPVYSGKLPFQVFEFMNVLCGKGKEATAVVVYGNRDYGTALYNMVKLLSEKGFRIAAAGAYIGQHSYSDIVPVAIGRPDETDIAKAHQLGKKSIGASRWLNLGDVPIQIDKISKSEKYSSIKPVHIEKKCIQCGKCAKKCPVGVLSVDTGKYLGRKAEDGCIGCMACVQVCKQKAKIAKVNPIVKLVMKKILKQASRERKEPLIIVARENA